MLTIVKALGSIPAPKKRKKKYTEVLKNEP
jgi:hypothetical protein